MRLILAKKSQDDAALVYQWRCDPDTLAASLHNSPEPFSHFWNRYQTRYFADALLPPYFIEVEGEKVGFIGFFCGEISIVISPEQRRRGFAIGALYEVKRVLLFRPISSITARIRRENRGSIALFTKAGFEKIAEGEVECYRLTLREESLSVPEVIAEIGSNWSSLEEAKRMIAAVAEAGASAAKFQLFRSETTYAAGAGSPEYLDADVEELFKEIELPTEYLPELAEECRRQKIEFLCSVFSEEDFEAVDPFVRRHKIASYEMQHLPLLKLVAESGKPLLLSTGASTLQEVADALEYFYAQGGEKVTLMQCTAAYPAELASMHLRVVRSYKRYFATPVGLSDHSMSIEETAFLATALGAEVIEKHVTFSKTAEGPDHAFSLEIQELKQFIGAVNKAHLLLGTLEKCVDPTEEPLRKFAKRRVHTTSAVQKGETLQLGKNIALLRSGNRAPGVSPFALEKLEGSVAMRDYEKGEGIDES